MADNDESSGSSVTKPIFDRILKRKSNDIGWEFGILVDPKNLDRVKCKLCGKVMSGGAYRMKEHVAHISGNVSACPRATSNDQARCRQAVIEAKNKKKSKTKEEDLSTSKTMQQLNINESLVKERANDVHQYVARWAYEAGIPLNAIDSDSFKLLVEAVSQFGPGFKPPSQCQLRETLLKEEVDRTKELLKKQEEEWALNGCSIVTNAWTDRKRSVMNLCVNCKKGTTFISFKEFSGEVFTAEHIFEYVDKCIEQVGPQNVVQVVTDNATNNMAVAKLLKEKRPYLFWTSCATHAINLMLECIGNLPEFKKIIDQAKTFTIFIYAHRKTLSLMRSFTKKRDIVRPGVTRFASSFLTLQSLVEKKTALRAMFNSEAWEKCKWAKTSEGKSAYSTVMSLDFWNGVTLCLKVFAPLVNVLRLVNGNRKPSIGFLHGELKKAKQGIREALNNVETNYRSIMDIINARAKDRLDSPLHVTAYLLNPYYFYKDPKIEDEVKVIEGILDCVEVIHADDIDMQDQIINIDFVKYKKKEGAFGRELAVKGCENNDANYDPVSWWSTYGNHTPTLQNFAKRIFSLTTSSFGCETNWSTFEWRRTKKMNRLDATQLNDLVFVQFNAKLRNKHKREIERNVDVLLANQASSAQGWIVAGGDDDEEDPHTGLTCELVNEASGADEMLQSRRSSIVRELHEDDFVSEDDEEENIDFEFESDEEHVLEEYGEEELDNSYPKV